MRELAGLAHVDRAVLLLAHVDKGTARGTAGGSDGYSGSTAWHNSARSRLYLSRDKDGALLLEHQKHNLGSLREPLRLLWPEGGIPQLDAPASGIVRAIGDQVDSKAILRLIHEFTVRGEFVGTATTSRTHAGKLLRGEPSFPHRLKDAALFDLLRQAERRAWIVRETFKGPDRKDRERWMVTPQGREFAGIAATAATAATSNNSASGAEAAALAATAATSPPRGVGRKSAHTKARGLEA